MESVGCYFHTISRYLLRNQSNSRDLFAKRCYRLYSSETYDREDKTSTNNSQDESVNPTFINRNPRNLEYLGIQHKRSGWPLQFPRKDYWHKLVFERTNRNTSAWVEHVNGSVVVSASTKETAIKQHLYSDTDVAAAENIGRVLAQRLKESGILEVMLDTVETPIVGPAVKSFTKALEDAGIALTEKGELQKTPDVGTDYDKISVGTVRDVKRLRKAERSVIFKKYSFNR